MDLCPCGSPSTTVPAAALSSAEVKPAVTAEQVMRSRYSAYVKKEIPYILTSLHPDHRADYDEKSSRAWAESAEWHGITILNTSKGGAEDSEGVVEFTVSYTERGMKQEHHERATFKKKDGVWFFSEGKTMPKPVLRVAPKTGRNDACVCGSGKKFKKCCGK